jgi:hypothetical protein
VIRERGDVTVDSREKKEIRDIIRRTTMLRLFLASGGMMTSIALP